MFDLQKKLGGRRVILASASPRRKELLKLVFDDFEIIPAECEENIPEGTPAGEASKLLAEQKCREVAERYPEALVIGCDTTVLLGEEILGKPEDEKDAFRMLRMLSGTRHSVVTGIALSLCGKLRSLPCETFVRFRRLSDEDINEYIATGEPADKAGAYGIQERGALLVSGIEGDFYNVVGLPVSELAQLAEEMLSEVE